MEEKPNIAEETPSIAEEKPNIDVESTQKTDVANSFETENSTESKNNFESTTQNTDEPQNAAQNNNAAQNDNAEQRDNAVQNENAEQSDNAVQNDNVEQNQNVEQSKSAMQSSNQTQNNAGKTSVQSVTPPARILANMHAVHIGKILSNISIVATALTLFMALLPFLSLGYMMAIILICGAIVVFTLGLVFTVENNIVSVLWGTLNNNTELLAEISLASIPILFGIAMGTAVTSLILLLCGKEKCTWRIVLNIVSIVLPLLCFLLMMVGVIGGAK